MKYELSDEQVKQIQNILANVTVKVSEAPIIMKLIQALNAPVKEKTS